MRPLLLSIVLATAVAGCQHVAPHTTAPASAPPADDNLHAVLWMQNSAEYRASAVQTWRAALAQLDVALADPEWDALVPAERANPSTGLPPAVIVDVDETVLDNSAYQARLVRDGTAYASGTWAAWVAEQAADAVPGAVEFAQAARERGVTMVYVTNRTEAMQAATIANLRAVGLPVSDPSVFLGKGTAVSGCESADAGDKACRRQLVGRRYRVLMQVGDQLGDFASVDPNTPAARASLMAGHGEWFGSHWWMLPNPSYGDWLPALFGNDWSLPAPAQRAAKRAALETAD